MKGKLVLTFGFAGALALSIGFAKDLHFTHSPIFVSWWLVVYCSFFFNCPILSF